SRPLCLRSFLFVTSRPTGRSLLFPYTTLFRSSVTCGGVTVCRFGVAASFDEGQAAAAMQRPTVDIAVDLGVGDRAATYLVGDLRSEEHTSELQSRENLVCRLLLEKKKKDTTQP